jgi:hypothetical protein
MMTDAVLAIESATALLTAFFQATPPEHLPTLNLSGLHEPLAYALAILYGQGNSSADNINANTAMLSMRLAMAQLMDSVLMYLILNDGFRRAFVVGWVPWLYPNVVNDNIWFAAQGWLAGSSGGEGEGTRAPPPPAPPSPRVQLRERKGNTVPRMDPAAAAAAAAREMREERRRARGGEESDMLEEDDGGEEDKFVDGGPRAGEAVEATMGGGFLF